MIYILSFLLFEILAVAAFTVNPWTADTQTAQQALIAVHIVFTAGYLMSRRMEFGSLILIGFLLRAGLMLGNYYDLLPIARDLFASSDSETFHTFATENARYRTEGATYTAYGDFLAALYGALGSARLAAQYINVVFGLGILMAVRQALRYLDVPKRTARIAMYAVCFFPEMIIYSVVLLREAWIQYALTLSALSFVCWMKSGKPAFMIGAAAAVVAGAWMHVGVMPVLGGYTLAYGLIDRKTWRSRITVRTVVVFALAGALTVGLGVGTDIFQDKLGSLDMVDTELLIEKVNMELEAGSAYLTWIDAQSVGQVLLFSPLKMLYFFFSPMIWDWRGAADAVAALTSSAFYLALFGVFFASYKKKYSLDPFRATLGKYLMIAVFCGAFMMALGSYNSGTAMRHRAKFLPVMVIACAVVTPPKGL